MIPQILIIALFLISLLIAANQHGKPKKGNHDFWASLIAVIINFALLYWGGFFNNLLR